MYRGNQLFMIKRLHDPTCRACAPGPVLQFLRTFSRQHKNRRGGALGAVAHGINDAEAIHPGPVDVGDNDIGFHTREFFQGVDAILGEVHIETRAAERKSQHVPHRRGIVYG